jgi:iron complex outermembrane recepter protein
LRVAKNFILILILACGMFLSHAQETPSCRFTITGKVFDRHDKEALMFAEIFIKELQKGSISDSAGNYDITNVCAGNYTLVCMHIGCDPVEKKISVTKDLRVNFILEHHVEELLDIEIKAKRIEEEITQQKIGLTEIERDRQSGKTLGDALKEISGVTTFNTGNTIAKPVIHGLYGNRILTINNGIRQEDQQWGNEHAPNIDPFSVDKISVIKGAAAVQYGSDALGGVILLEQEEAVEKTEGAIYAIGNSNGRGGALSGNLKGYIDAKNEWSYKLHGTVKRSGDLQSPHYNLSNTGAAEQSAMAQMQYKTWKHGIKLFYSFYHANIGILRASHIGNTTDLNNALQSAQPYFVENFTYDISSPRQDISHHIYKAEYFLRMKKGGKLTVQYAGQFNSRKEFDIRRGGRTDIAALDLSLQTHTADIFFQNTTKRNLHQKFGITGVFQNNYNVPGTGFRPILPDYNMVSSGIFFLERYKKNRWEVEAGARYDFRFIDTKRFSRTNELQNEQFIFHNAAVSLGAIFSISENFSFRSNVGSAFRPPNVYELLSDGVHQSAAVIEEGDITLKSEQSIKWINTFSASVLKNKLQIEVSPYYNFIKNYIFLQPEAEPRLTIRGAFPVFVYKQTDAGIAGLDFDLKYDIIKFVRFAHRISFLYGRDLSSKNHLIYMPPIQFSDELTFQSGKLQRIKNVFLSFIYSHVFRQYWYPEGVDFIPPPKGYHLLNIHAGIVIPFKSQSVSVIFQADNVLNAAYRDYLNRFRYYADNMGRNFSIKIKYHFSFNPKNKKQ